MQNSGSFVLGTQQLHFERFTLNTLDDTTALSTQDVHCAFTVLPNTLDFREANTTEYHLYDFCLLYHVHGKSRTKQQLLQASPQSSPEPHSLILLQHRE
ncbi:hypothetical protein EK904_011381, partial [Melospiza melodia maxima]